MYNYTGTEVDTIYTYDGDVVEAGSDSGYVTAPEYITVNGNNYRLTWHDEFEAKDINKDFWGDVQFTSNVPKRYQAWSDYYLGDSLLHLRIKKDAPDRFLDDPDNNVAQTMIVSGQCNFYPLSDPQYHDINPFFGLLVQEGYWECRFKVFPATGGCHTAIWTLGVYDGETDLTPRAEIDVTEIKAHQSTQLPHGVHPATDTSTTEFYVHSEAGVNFATGFHTVGFLWENGLMKWYVDGNVVDTKSNINTPQYPMFILLSAYKRISGTGWTGDADTTLGDVEFLIDYLRIYKKATSVSSGPVSVSGYTPITINGNTRNMTIGDDRGCPLSFPHFVYVNWSDGTRTEHWVKWNAINPTYQTKMTNHQSFEWAGYVYTLGMQIVANVTY